MWSVLRKLQGVPYSSETRYPTLLPPITTSHPETTCQTSISMSCRILTQHEAKPHVDRSLQRNLYLPRPFRSVFLNYLLRVLVDDTSSVLNQVQTLYQIHEKFSSHPKYALEALDLDILPLLMDKLHQTNDVEIRWWCLNVLHVMFRVPGIQAQIIHDEPTNHYLRKFIALLSDQDNPPEVIICLFDVLNVTHGSWNQYKITHMLFQLDAVPRYIDCLNNPDNGVVKGSCEGLIRMLDVKESFLLMSSFGIINIITTALEIRSNFSKDSNEKMTEPPQYAGSSMFNGGPYSLSSLMESILTLMGKLCLHYSLMRRLVLEANTLKTFSKFLTHTNTDVRRHTAEIMCLLSTETPAKHQAEEVGIFDMLVNVIQNEDSPQVFMWLCKLVEMLCEYPPARKVFRSVYPRIEEIKITAQYQENIPLVEASKSALNQMFRGVGQIESFYKFD